jgi:outer membrane protein OmpA-like peptidoglycan-associated protein
VPAAAATLALTVALTSTLSSACSTPPPAANNAVPPPASAPVEAPITWVALGGDETAAVGPPEEAGRFWTQQVLAELPPTAQLVNLAAPDATARRARTTQMRTLDATGVRPTVATVWFGADESSGSAAYAADLTALVQDLRDRGATEIILVTRTGGSGAGGVGSSLTDVTEQVATATGTTFVEVDLPGRDPTTASAQAAAAQALSPALTD